MAFINCSSLRELMASRKASWDSNWSSTIWPATNWKMWEKHGKAMPNSLRTWGHHGSPSIPVRPSVTSSFWMDQVDAFVSTAWSKTLRGSLLGSGTFRGNDEKWDEHLDETWKMKDDKNAERKKYEKCTSSTTPDVSEEWLRQTCILRWTLTALATWKLLSLL